MDCDILEIVTSVQLGGAENVAFELAEPRLLNGKPFRPVMVELFRSDSAYAQAKHADLMARGIRVITLSSLSKRPALLVAPIRLARLIAKLRPQVIHAHTDLPDLVVSFALRATRALGLRQPRVMRTIHNAALWATHPGIGAFVERGIRDDAVIAVSEAALNAYEALRKASGAELAADRRVIYNGGDAVPQAQPAFDIDRSLCNILFCGRFDAQKGIDLFVPMVRAVQAALPGQYAFHFIGAGPQIDLLRALQSTTPGVHLHGAVNRASTLFHAFDYLVMPSRFEGLPLVAIESAMAGVPVMATRAPGLNETVPLDWPLYFELGDAGSLISILKALAEGRWTRDALGSQLQAFATARFDRSTMLKRYDEVFARLVAGTAASNGAPRFKGPGN